MREIILKTLEEIANNCQINFGSESARIMITDKLDSALKNYASMIMEDIACPPNEDRCCGGECHEE